MNNFESNTPPGQKGPPSQCGPFFTMRQACLLIAVCCFLGSSMLLCHTLTWKPPPAPKFDWDDTTNTTNIQMWDSMSHSGTASLPDSFHFRPTGKRDSAGKELFHKWYTIRRIYDTLRPGKDVHTDTISSFPDHSKIPQQ